MLMLILILIFIRARGGDELERLSPAGRPAGRRRTLPRARDSDNSSSCNDYNDNSSGSNSAAGWWIVVMASGRHDLFFSCARARACEYMYIHVYISSSLDKQAPYSCFLMFFCVFFPHEA